MGFEGCTPIDKHPGRTHLDPPANPTYYALGDRETHVDIARVLPDAEGWFMDDGVRVEMSTRNAVNLVHTQVSAY